MKMLLLFLWRGCYLSQWGSCLSRRAGFWFCLFWLAELLLSPVSGLLLALVLELLLYLVAGLLPLSVGLWLQVTAHGIVLCILSGNITYFRFLFTFFYVVHTFRDGHLNF